MYKVQDSNSSLGAWYDPLKEAVAPLAQQVGPAAMGVLIPAALDYVGRNEAKIRQRIRPVAKRILREEAARYGRETYYPGYGKYAAPAIAVGAGLLAGGLGSGFVAIKKASADSEKASKLFALTYLLQLAGTGLVFTGALLSVGNKMFPHK